MPRIYFSRIETIDYLIRIKGTGTPKNLAKKIGLSQSRLYEYLQFMKEMNAPIIYSKERCSYIYKIEGYFDFKFKSKLSDS